MKKPLLTLAISASVLALASCSTVSNVVDRLGIGDRVTMHAVDASGVKGSVGTISLTSTGSKGVMFSPSLKGLPPGTFGFHIHANGSCDPAMVDGKMTAAAAAGSHYDPDNAGKHGPPEGPGHRGDLPVLVVDANGVAERTVISTRLTLDEIKGRAIMIHAGGDNYSDSPAPLGGGGARMYCGVIKK